MVEMILVEMLFVVVFSVDDSSLYIYCEFFQLQFNICVLEQVLDEFYLFLEWLKFFFIFLSNFDEFFEICIVGLKKQIIFVCEQVGVDGLLLYQVLVWISELVYEQVLWQYWIFNEILLLELVKYQICFICWCYWMLKIKIWVWCFFCDEIVLIIILIGFDLIYLFLLLVNKSFNFIVELEGMDVFGCDFGLVIILVLCLLLWIIRLLEDVGGEGDNYVFLLLMIYVYVDDLFFGMKVKGCYQFCLICNVDLLVDIEDVEDLVCVLCGELFLCCYGDVVCLEVVDICLQNLINYLFKQFGLFESELYKVSGLVNLICLFSVIGLESYLELQYLFFILVILCFLQKKENFFNVFSKFDVLLMYLFEFFILVIDLLCQVVKDLNVLVIKQILYCSGVNFEIVDVLVEVVCNGKEVIVVIELCVCFDEEFNL